MAHYNLVLKKPTKDITKSTCKFFLSYMLDKFGMIMDRAPYENNGERRIQYACRGRFDRRTDEFDLDISSNMDDDVRVYIKISAGCPDIWSIISKVFDYWEPSKIECSKTFPLREGDNGHLNPLVVIDYYRGSNEPHSFFSRI